MAKKMIVVKYDLFPFFLVHEVINGRKIEGRTQAMAQGYFFYNKDIITTLSFKQGQALRAKREQAVQYYNQFTEAILSGLLEEIYKDAPYLKNRVSK